MGVSIDDSFFSVHCDVSSFLDLFEFLPEVIFFAKDRESRFVAANSAMLAAKGLSDSAELLGRSDLDFHPPALAQAYIDEDRKIMDSGKPLPNQVWFVIDQTGRPGWFRSSKTPLRSWEGSVVGIAGIRYAITTPAEKSQQFRNMTAAIQFIEENYNTAISTKQLAEIAGLSVTHFNRRFSELFKMSPNRFLQSLRVERARQLLTLTQDSITDIATETGFYDQSHLNRHFKNLTGMTPRMYRKRF